MAGNKGSIANIRKKFHQTHELISTSYHEAGHTVYGLLHFMKIESVLVFEEKKSKRICGFTHYDSPSILEIKDPDLFNERLHSEICLSYAGLVAERRHFKIISGSDKFPMFLRDGSSTDINYASILFQKYNLQDSGKKRYDYKQSLMKDIDSELQEHWDAVTLVAHSLFKKKKLYFYELRSLLSKNSEHNEFWKEQCITIGNFYQNAGTLDEKELKYILSL